MGKDKAKEKRHEKKDHHPKSNDKDDTLWDTPSPKESKTKSSDRAKKPKKDKRKVCHTSKNFQRPAHPFSNTCLCSHKLPRSFPLKQFPPPDPPEGGRDLWDLQFCRWWGWNWVRKRDESMMLTQMHVSQKARTSEPAPTPAEPMKARPDPMKKSCLAKCRGTTDDEIVAIRAEARLKKASFISEPQIQPPPPVSAKAQFKEMCKCLFGKKSAPPAVAKMYKTPSASKVYLDKDEDASEWDSETGEEVSEPESVESLKKGKSRDKRGAEKAKKDKKGKKEKRQHSKEEKVKTWRRENYQTESTPTTYSEAAYSYKPVPCGQPQPEPSQHSIESPMSKSSTSHHSTSSKSSKKEPKRSQEIKKQQQQQRKEGSTTEESMEYLTFRLHHIRDNCPCNPEQPEKLQIYMGEAPPSCCIGTDGTPPNTCCLGMEKKFLPEPQAQEVVYTATQVPEKLSVMAAPQPTQVQEGFCQSTCLGLMDHEVWAENETLRVHQETQTNPIKEDEQSCGTCPSNNSTSYVEKLVKVKSRQQKTICIMVCCCGACNNGNKKECQQPAGVQKDAPLEGCIKQENTCSCVKCPKQCWLKKKKNSNGNPPMMAPSVESPVTSQPATPIISEDPLPITKKEDSNIPPILTDSLDVTDDISALFASTMSNKKLSKFGTPSKKYPWMESMTSAGTTTSLDQLGYHQPILSDILERDSSSFGRRSTEDRVILEAMCDAILQEQMDNVYTFLDHDLLTSSYKEFGVDCHLKTATKDAFNCPPSQFFIEKPLASIDNTISSIMDTIFSESDHVVTPKMSKEMTCTTYDRYEYVPRPPELTRTGLMPQEVKRAPKRPLEVKEVESKKKLKQEDLVQDAKREGERMNHILSQIEQIVTKSKEKSAEIQKILNVIPQAADLDLDGSKRRCYAICSDSFRSQPLITPKVSELSETDASRTTTLNQGNLKMNQSSGSVSKRVSKLSIQNFVVCDERPRPGTNCQLVGTSGTKKNVCRPASLIPVRKSSGSMVDDS